MNDPAGKRLTAEEARALWERALEMQMEAARRAEERALSSGEVTDPKHEEWGFTAEEVAAAAREAGISAEFMDAALAEMQLGRSAELGREDRVDRAADRLLHDPRKVLEISRQIAASPSEVLDVMRVLFPESPYFLTLKDVRGDPLADGVLVFAAPGWNAAIHQQTPFVHAMLYGGLDLLFITVRPRGKDEEADAPPHSEIMIRAPLRNSRRSNWWWALGLGGTTSLGAGGAGLVLGLVVGGAVLSPPLAAAAGLGAGLAAAGGTGAANVWAFRRMFGWGIGKAERALDDLLSAVDVRIRSGGGFRIPDPTGRSGRAPDALPRQGRTFRSE